ncbi:MAG: putative glycoside hydrolase [Thermomicrobiales bacterium]
MSIAVSDRYTGKPLPGAMLAFNGQSVTTAPDGSATVDIAADSLQVIISAPDYEAVSTTLHRGGPRDWQVALRPNVLRGTITDADSKAGIPDIEVALNAAGGVVNTTTTGSDGSFTFAGVPEGATLTISSTDYGSLTAPIEQQTNIALTMKPSLVTGTVTDVGGNPIIGARVSAVNGTAATTSGPDGSFRLSGGSDVGELKITAPGFSDQVVMVDDSRQIAAVLETEQIKAIYANLGVLSDPERWNRLLEIADTTEINAIVVDVKQDTIYYDTQVPFFRDIEGMVTPVFDPQELLAELDAHGIYSIARMVVFKDPLVAKARPDLSVKDENTGEPWLDYNDVPWVNAFYQELWQANADLGAELAHLGFDEVQYDYIRFPSDGNLKTADFGNDYSEADRRAAITGAVALASEQIHAAGANFALDLFPIVALLGDDQGIGQTLQDLTPYADFVCLMIYPSHYALGNIPVDGHPNDFPAETVTYTLQRSQEWAPDTMNKMRPWLQDFTYPAEGFSAYGPEQVRAQIDAAEAMGVSGWLLWNAAGEFEVDALKPQ